MSIDFQDITIIANPEQAQVRDGSRIYLPCTLSLGVRVEPPRVVQGES